MGDKETTQSEMTELLVPRHTPYMLGGELEIKESEILPRGENGIVLQGVTTCRDEANVFFKHSYSLLLFTLLSVLFFYSLKCN